MSALAGSHLPRRSVKTIFLSDLHLGTVGCKGAALYDFIKNHEADEIFLVGDVLDTWRSLDLNVRKAHHDVLKLLSQRAAEGCRVVYIPGNHDSFFRNYIGKSVFGFEILNDAAHTLADGRKILVTHGDQCDLFSNRHRVVSKMGAWVEAAARGVEMRINAGLARLGVEPWYGIQTAIKWTNRKIRQYDHFEDRLTQYARIRGFDGIICGHFHQEDMTMLDDMLYANCGDWIDNCSAIIESHRGELDLVIWKEATRRAPKRRWKKAWI